MSASMIAAYFVDPKSIEKPKDEEKDEDDTTSKKSEYVIMGLLFTYITICCNTEHSFGSGLTDMEEKASNILLKSCTNA